jgi:putative cobalt transporter subunit CbtA
MLRTLLIWGLLAGLCGGLLATGFSEVAGEPAVNQAINFEYTQAKAAGEPAEKEIVTRGVQRSVGLLTAAAVFGVSMGGLFALAFAFAYGRVGRASPRRTALWLAAGAFVVVYLVPFLKYPANPP